MNNNSDISLDNYGIHSSKINYNLTVSDLYSITISKNLGRLTSQGALSINTGKFTGRSPKDRYKVRDNITDKKVWWGDINIPIDIVDVFRPSKEAPGIAKKAVKIGSKVLWLQYGLHSDEAEKISASSKIQYISDKCIKQEYQKLFEKSNPVFPVLRN